MAKNKYYVVWEGRDPGIYDNWDDAEEQISGFPGAKFKAYPDLDSATRAYRGDPKEQMGLYRAMAARQHEQLVNYAAFPEIDPNGIAVDGACSKNPGPMEYRGVHIGSGQQIFHFGPAEGGTNNIGEYLALIHAAALLKQRGDLKTPIYTDSKTALAWLRAGHSRTHIQPTPQNARVRELLRRADAWLAANGIANPVRKWQTEQWGEIPADFGRK